MAKDKGNSPDHHLQDNKAGWKLLGAPIPDDRLLATDTAALSDIADMMYEFIQHWLPGERSSLFGYRRALGSQG